MVSQSIDTSPAQAWTEDLCQHDSDGDGFTNGEELGDPCCLFKFQADGVDPDYQALMDGWEVTHPGDATAFPTENPSVSCAAYEDSGTVRSSFCNEGEECYSVEFRMKPHVIASDKTTYVDFVFDLPAEDAARCASGCYMIGAVPIIEHSMVHHYFTGACYGHTWASEGLENGDARPIQDEFASAGDIAELADSFTTCGQIVMGWAPGQDPMVIYPENVASYMTGLTGFRMQVHFDNPSLVAGEVDVGSGFTFHYVVAPRAHQIGGINTQKVFYDFGGIRDYGVQGQPVDTAIPAGLKRWFLTRECVISGATEPAYPYDVGFHAHLLGREMYMDLWRGGKRFSIRDEQKWHRAGADKSCLSRIPTSPISPRTIRVAAAAAASPRSASRNAQIPPRRHFDDQINPLAPPMRLENGDRIATTCVMDSTARTEDTRFWFETTDEMCSGLLLYRAPSP